MFKDRTRPLFDVGVCQPPGARSRSAWLATLAAALCLTVALTAASTARAAQSTTFTATQTLPVAPASDYSGSGGGDGWAVALSSTQVFNVFHHQSTLTFACHQQSDASACYAPETITDGAGNEFATQGQPGLHLDQSTGKLYVYATRPVDSTAGVVCIDTTIAATNPNPFCGFTALTPAGEGPTSGGISAVGDPSLVGSHWYAFNFVSGAASTGAENKLLCFDVSTDAACAGQPFAVTLGAGTMQTSSSPPPAQAAIGTQVIIPISISGKDFLACFDDSTQTDCSGTWPAALSFSYTSLYGAPYPLLDPTGAITGFCLPTGIDQCYTLAGAPTATPANMTSAVVATSPWNGPAFVLGPRVYVPDGQDGRVDCFDYNTGQSCTNYPKTFSNLGLLYTVNPDPQRPTCIWVNADNGQSQIQSFDAYTGGACGQGQIRALASQFVVNKPACYPITYKSLQVVSPARSTYTSGSVQFADGDGNAIPGAADRPLDGTGTVDLSGLSLNTATGLPQFLIDLSGAGNPGQIVITLTWTATYDPSCIGSGTTVAQTPTATATALSGGGHAGPQISVPGGTAVSDSATLSGNHSGSAGGTVTYTVYSDSTCSMAVSSGSAQSIRTPGSLPPSASVKLNNPGTYYWVATFSGDGGNFASSSRCGDEVESVTSKAAAPPVNVKRPPITGTALPGHVLTCATGTWTNHPTSYTYSWSRNGKPITGATAARYTVKIADEAATLTCTVTARNSAGSGRAATSRGRIVSTGRGTLRCPRPSGHVSGKKVGVFTLGSTRGNARKRIRRYQVTHNGFDNFCLYAGWGIRVGYPSRALLKRLPQKQRGQFAGRAVLALTANPFYALNGVKPGTKLSRVAKRMHVHKPFHVGVNYWYFIAADPARGVLKVRGGVIQEVGLASKPLTRTRAQQRRFIHSFS
jgi:hypothetical protein